MNLRVALNDLSGPILVASGFAEIPLNAFKRMTERPMTEVMEQSRDGNHECFALVEVSSHFPFDDPQQLARYEERAQTMREAGVCGARKDQIRKA